MAYRIKIKQDKKTLYYKNDVSVGTKKEVEYLKKYLNKRDKKKLKRDKAKLIVTRV